MRVRAARLSTLVVLTGLLVGIGTSAKAAAPSVSGTITVSGDSTALEHVIVTAEFDNAVAVTVSEIELPPPCQAGDIQSVAQEKEISALYFLFDVETQSLYEPGFLTLYDPRLDGSFETFEDREGVSLSAGADGLISGTLVHTVTNWEGTEFQIDLELSFPVTRPATSSVPRKISGAEDKPAKSFVKFVDAWMAGDFEGVKKLTAADFREMMDETDPTEAVEMMVEFADDFIPRVITITETLVDGDSAVISATGESPACMGVKRSAGTIKMHREKSKWKVGRVSFESGD